MIIKDASFSVLVGKTLTAVENVDNEEIFFATSDGSKYWMGHHQDCCESVEVEEIIGDLQDLIGSPILLAEEVTKESETTDIDFRQTWTFYKLSTVKSSVTIRWLGESNGYYSESVDFGLVKYSK